MRFLNDVKSYFNYFIYSAKAELKAEVSNSYLSCMWWILDPLLFMLVYSFVVSIVFGTSQEHLLVFVFIGLTVWTFFNKVVTASVNLVIKRKSIISRIYVPKFVFIFTKMGVHLFKMGVSLALVFILMILTGVNFTFYMFYLIPIIAILMIVTFGFSTILMHLGVFIGDFKNIVTVVLRLFFYTSGVFYSITDRISESLSKYLEPNMVDFVVFMMLKANPIAFLMDQSRVVLINGNHPDFMFLFIWLVIGLLLSLLGVHLIYKHENTYVKVI